MKRIYAMLLAALLLTGCAAEEPPADTTGSTAPSTTAPTVAEVQIPKSGEITVLGCSFKEEVLPADYEVYVGRFPAEEGKIFVDLTLSVKNTCQYPIGEKDITGYFEYGGKRYTMQFEVEENAGDFANTQKQVDVGETKTVHLFYRVDRKAEDAALTVHYSAFGQAYQAEVQDQTEPEKRQLNIGEVFTREGMYSVEIMDCMIAPHLRATGSGAVKYYVEGSHVFSLVIKLRNEGDADLSYLEGYLLAGDHPEFASIQMEVKDNKELEDTTTVKAGQEQILHLWVAVPADTPAEGMSMRLNILGDSFYCCPVG
jgi:hypothetical protein